MYLSHLRPDWHYSLNLEFWAVLFGIIYIFLFCFQIQSGDPIFYDIPIKFANQWTLFLLCCEELLFRFLWEYNFILLPAFYFSNEQRELERNRYYQDLQGLLKLTSAIAGYTWQFLMCNFSISTCNLALRDNRERESWVVERQTAGIPTIHLGIGGD